MKFILLKIFLFLIEFLKFCINFLFWINLRFLFLNFYSIMYRQKCFQNFPNFFHFTLKPFKFSHIFYKNMRRWKKLFEDFSSHFQKHQKSFNLLKMYFFHHFNFRFKISTHHSKPNITANVWNDNVFSAQSLTTSLCILDCFNWHERQVQSNEKIN